MPSKKDRLYIVLYARSGKSKMPGQEDTYHWALMIGPKDEEPSDEGTLFHAKETVVTVGSPPKPQWVWTYDEKPIPVRPTQMLLVRVIVGKVKDQASLRAALRGTPIQPDVPGWNCVYWVKDALQAAFSDKKALGTSVGDWTKARDGAMSYVTKKKAEHRFDGVVQYDNFKAATWDMLEGREIFP